jgi:uncharacterized protein (UPF0303 family)
MTNNLAKLVEQERRLVFPRFDEALAFDLGAAIRRIALAEGLAIVCEVALWDRPLFYMALPGTTSDNPEWVRRKANVVKRFGKSTYRMVLEKGARPGHRALPNESNAPLEDYVLAGGGFPIRVEGAGIVGSATVSGVPEHVDHMLVVRGLCAVLSVDENEMMLPDAP